MDNLSSSGDYDLGYQPSISSVDQSTSETPGHSTLSGSPFAYCRTNSETSAFSDPVDENSSSSEPSPALWPIAKSRSLTRLSMRPRRHSVDDKLDDRESTDSELDVMKERFAKLLLGEDMSGSGKGVCTAVTISNAITNLYATVFGQNLRLEPLNPDKKALWKREMDCLLSVCEYIVDFSPTSQDLDDGTTVEVMASTPRPDIYLNLPALQKLDMMLIEILDSFADTEFWYAKQGSMSGNSTRSGSFRRIAQRKEEKWWLPVPCVSPGGLSEKARKQLRNKRDCANQIHKAAMAINGTILAEIEIPDTFIATLPKSGKACLGDSIYRFICNTDNFSPDQLLDSLNIASEHEALELADRVEASMYTWRRKACLSNSRSSWDLVKDLMADTDRNDKNHVLAERAASLLFCLKHRYPELSQTTLDTSKIQYNRDVGKAILESYSRVLEGLAFNIVAWIEDVLHEDKNVRHEQ